MLNFKEKNLYKFISILACCLFLFISPVYADETYTVEWGGSANPNEPRFLTKDVVDGVFVNPSTVCTDYDSLTSEQKAVVLEYAADPHPYNFIFVDDELNAYVGKGIFINSSYDGQLKLWGNSSITGNGLYNLNTDGSMTFIERFPTVTIRSYFLFVDNMGGGSNYIEPFNITTSACDVSNEFSLVVNVNDSSLGSATGTGTFEKYSEVTIYASPSVDSRFVQWSNGSTENPYTFTLSSNMTITAVFESTVSIPNLNLPDVTLPQQTINTEQNTYLNTHSSNAVKGGSINLFQIDYYNVYTVLQTAESDEFFDSRNDNYYVYQNSSDGIGHYIFAVYDKSKLYVFAPNMSVSSSGFTLTYSQAHNMSYSYASSNGLIQRDVNKFEFEYIDKTLHDYYGYDKLPFSNSSNNQNHLEWIGTKTKMLNGQASSMSAALTLNTGTIMTNLNFVITDTTNSYENAQMMNNQTVINNNMNQNFTELNNTIFDGDTETQQVVSNNDANNDELNSTIDQYNQLEQSFKDDLDDNLNAIDFTFDFGGIADFSTSANFVRTQFDNLTNNPYGSLIGFSLAVGLALLIIGRRL